MKATILALFVALLMVGCGEETHYSPPLTEEDVKIIAEAIDVNTIQKRGKRGEELYYALNEQTPYTGWAKGMRDNGQIQYLAQIEDGKLHGPATFWHDNGQKNSEFNFKDGKLHGFQIGWYENGQRQSEGNYEDGKIMSVVVWKPNGEKCPVTNVKDGNGVWVWYNKDGTEARRSTFKDGERVED